MGSMTGCWWSVWHSAGLVLTGFSLHYLPFSGQVMLGQVSGHAALLCLDLGLPSKPC